MNPSLIGGSLETLQLGILAGWAGCALATLSAWGFWLALLAVLTIKAALEEAWMTRAHPDYAGYRARTRRFLPWLL